MNRREFFKAAVGLSACAAIEGCATARSSGSGSMQGFACAPLKRIRVGFVGIGLRGVDAVKRFTQIPGVEIAALCDLQGERIAVMNDWLEKRGYGKVEKTFVGREAYKALCEWDGVDVVYNTTPWQLHAAVGLYALRSGKHSMVEVPAAMTLDECWEFVETAEKYRLHCMQLENCCYGSTEMFALSLCRQGVLGEIVHGEGAYVHDLRHYQFSEHDKEKMYTGYWNHWRLRWNEAHDGNQYPTHGLGPVAQYMNLNRGDRFDYLCSISCAPKGLALYGREKFPSDSWQAREKIAMGDMNSTVIRTVKGRSILVQHDVTSARPYTRLNLVSGTRGVYADYPQRLAVATEPGGGAHAFLEKAELEKYYEKYKHPLYRDIGEFGLRVGGHGGMDFMMDLRWCYCLQNGLPLDMDVYDLASWCSICELSERSVRERRFVEVPDFTNGGWRTAKPLGLETIDTKKMDLSKVVAVYD